MQIYSLLNHMDSIFDNTPHSAKLMPAGSVHFSSRAPIGYVAISSEPLCTNQGFKSLIPAESVFNEYLYYYLKASKQLAEQRATGTTFKEISGTAFGKLPTPLAPFNEQKRIVAKIEALFSELDKGMESLKTAREQLKVYRQAVLKHAFEGKLTADWREENKDKLETADELLERIKQEREVAYQQQLQEWQAAVNTWEQNGKEGKKPTKPRKIQSVTLQEIPDSELPNGWAWEHLGNLNSDVFDGPFGSNLKTNDYVEEGIRVIRLENIGSLQFIEEKHSYITEEKYKSIEKHTVRSGDIIFSSFITEGIRLTILPETIKCAVNKADCFCVRLNGNTVRNDYIASFLSTRVAYKQIESEIHGIGRPRINTTQLKGFSIPLCSRKEQDEIMSQLSEKLSLIENVDKEILTELEKTKALRQSILKKAFSGKLVAQDPNDEPASVLLERIKAEKEGNKKKRSAA